MSVSSEGTEANDDSHYAELSHNGRYVVFSSYADNLVAEDTNGRRDVFVFDRKTGDIKRTNVASDGSEANETSGYFIPRISGDGRFVVFTSSADNLVPGDSNGTSDIFVHDTQTGLTERCSISNDGTEANGASWAINISADGRFVTFDSDASNLVTADTNGVNDIFVHDRQSGLNTRVNVASDGTQANAGNIGYWGYWHSYPISADGRFVAYSSLADNLVVDDGNGTEDVFVHDLQAGQTQVVSVSSTGEVGNGTSLLHDMSADGRFVVFYSSSTNLSPDGKEGLFSHDRAKAETVKISDFAFNAAISDDGRYIAFSSYLKDVVPWDSNDQNDVYIFDHHTKRTIRVNRAYNGGETNMGSYWASISGDGKYVGFDSSADNLVPGDTNGASDVFVTGNPFLLPINPGLNDAWYNPETPGQGFWVTVFPELKKAAVAWLTYDTELPPAGATAHLGDSGHRWITATGSYVDNQAHMKITLTSGGIFNEPTQVQRTDPPGSDGSIILTFYDCNSATIEYDIRTIDRRGIIPIQRVAGDNVVVCEAFKPD